MKTLFNRFGHNFIAEHVLSSRITGNHICKALCKLHCSFRIHLVAYLWVTACVMVALYFQVLRDWAVFIFICFLCSETKFWGRWDNSNREETWVYTLWERKLAHLQGRTKWGRRWWRLAIGRVTKGWWEVAPSQSRWEEIRGGKSKTVLGGGVWYVCEDQRTKGARMCGCSFKTNDKNLFLKKQTKNTSAFTALIIWIKGTLHFLQVCIS